MDRHGCGQRVRRRFWTRLASVAVVPALAGGALAACELPGATFVVSTTADGVDAAPGDGACATGTGACTLRAAVMEANARPGPDNITIGDATYDLTLAGTGEDLAAAGDLDVTGSVAITGPGTIDANALDRVFDVRNDALILDGPTVTGGDLPSHVPQAFGGGIRVATGAHLVGLGITVRDNAAFLGGGGIVSHGTVALHSSTVRENWAIGLFFDEWLDPIPAYGGGILVQSGSLSIVDSTVADNGVSELGSGGGIASTDPAATIALTASTVSANQAPGVASISGGTITLTRTTVEDPGPWSAAVSGSSVTVRSSTATTGFGPVLSGGVVTVSGSIIASMGNDCSTRVTSLGWNLFTDASCGPVATDVTAADPLLGPLADNGGPTRTRLPQAGSPVLDVIPAGTPGLCDASATTDQRGFPRPVGPGCDAGAVER